MMAEKSKEQLEKEYYQELAESPMAPIESSEIGRIMIKGAMQMKLTAFEEMELKLAWCQAHDVPEILAQDLYVVYGRVSATVAFKECRAKKAVRTLEFDTKLYSDTKVIINCRRNKESNWIPAIWSIDRAKTTKKGKISLYDDWIKQDRNIPTMLRNRCIGELVDTVVPEANQGLVDVETAETEGIEKQMIDKEDLAAQETALDDVKGPAKSTEEVVTAIVHDKERKTGQKMSKKLENYDPEAELKTK